MAWRDQVALVTGGARGIGAATARLLAKRGAAVCVNYAQNAEAAKSLVAEIIAAGGRAVAARADVADVAAVEEIVARTEKELGAVTILVNNAGMSWRGTLDTYDPEQVARMHRVNVEGVTNVTRAVMGGMRERRYGRIVNVSSIAAIGTALPGNAFYAATKAEVAIGRAFGEPSSLLIASWLPVLRRPVEITGVKRTLVTSPYCSLPGCRLNDNRGRHMSAGISWFS